MYNFIGPQSVVTFHHDDGVIVSVPSAETKVEETKAPTAATARQAEPHPELGVELLSAGIGQLSEAFEFFQEPDAKDFLEEWAPATLLDLIRKTKKDAEQVAADSSSVAINLEVLLDNIAVGCSIDDAVKYLKQNTARLTPLLAQIDALGKNLGEIRMGVLKSSGSTARKLLFRLDKAKWSILLVAAGAILMATGWGAVIGAPLVVAATADLVKQAFDRTKNERPKTLEEQLHSIVDQLDVAQTRVIEAQGECEGVLIQCEQWLSKQLDRARFTGQLPSQQIALLRKYVQRFRVASAKLRQAVQRLPDLQHRPHVSLCC